MLTDKAGNTQWEHGDGAHVPRSHHVVSDEGKCGGIAGSTHFLGSLQECREYQMINGVRATTAIEVF